MLNQDHNVWCSSSFIQQTFKGQKWELGFSFYQPVHNQVPHRAVPAGDWNCQGTHPSPSLSFKHRGLVCAPLWQEHCSPTQGSGEGLLQQDAQISEHKLAAAPVVVTCGSPETLLLPPCSSLLCLIIKKRGKGSTLQPDSPQGQFDSTEIAEILIPVELQLVPSQ